MDPDPVLDLTCALLEFGVDCGMPEARRAKAEALVLDGVSEDGLRRVALQLEAENPENPAKVARLLAALALDPPILRLRIADLEYADIARAHRLEALQAATMAPRKEVPHMVNLPVGTLSCGCDACGAARAKGVATADPADIHERIAARLRGDRVPAETVAEEFGVPLAAVEAVAAMLAKPKRAIEVQVDELQEEAERVVGLAKFCIELDRPIPSQIVDVARALTRRDGGMAALGKASPPRQLVVALERGGVKP